MESANSIDQSLQPYLNPPPVMAVITGPSGVGKDVILHRLVELGARFYFVVTATDRPRRMGEVDGVDYYFVSTAEFEQMIARDELIEHTPVYGQYKGVPKIHVRQALDSGLDVLMRVDLRGADTIRAKVPGAITIFLAPPSLAVLEQRLRERDTDSEAQIHARLEAAVQELGRTNEFDYVVINRQDDLDGAARQVMAILEAERRRANRRPIEI